MSSAGYATLFLTSVYLSIIVLIDINFTFLWYTFISPGLYLFSIIFSALFASRLVLALLTGLRDEFSQCSTISAFMYTKFAAVHPGSVPSPLGYIICLSQELIFDVPDSAHPASGADPRFLASAITTDISHCPLQVCDDYTFILSAGNPRQQLLTSRSSVYGLGLNFDSSPSLVESLPYDDTSSGSFTTGSLRHNDAIDILCHENMSGHKLCLGAVPCSYTVKLFSVTVTTMHNGPATLIDNYYAMTYCLSFVVITVGVSCIFYIRIFGVCAEIMLLNQ